MEMPRENPENFADGPVEQEILNPHNKIKLTKEPSCTPKTESSWWPEFAYLTRIAK